jgi:hypothetical protein
MPDNSIVTINGIEVVIPDIARTRREVIRFIDRMAITTKPDEEDAEPATLSLVTQPVEAVEV